MTTAQNEQEKEGEKGGTCFRGAKPESVKKGRGGGKRLPWEKWEKTAYGGGKRKQNDVDGHSREKRKTTACLYLKAGNVNT